MCVYIYICIVHQLLWVVSLSWSAILNYLHFINNKNFNRLAMGAVSTIIYFPD